MSGHMKHVGFQLNPDKPVDSKCADILSNLPKGENVCSYIRKAIIFYHNNNGKVADRASNLSTDEKLDLILSKLEGMGSVPVPTETPAPVEKEVKKSNKPNKKVKKEEPEKEIEPEEEIEDEEEPETEIKYSIPEEEPQESPQEESEDDTIKLSVDAASDIEPENFDAIMGDFLDS